MLVVKCLNCRLHLVLNNWPHFWTVTQENCAQPCCKEYCSFSVSTIRIFSVSDLHCSLHLPIYFGGHCCTLRAHALVTDQFLCFPLNNWCDVQWQAFLTLLIFSHQQNPNANWSDSNFALNTKNKLMTQVAMVMFLMLKTKSSQGEMLGYNSFLHERVNM